MNLGPSSWIVISRHLLNPLPLYCFVFYVSQSLATLLRLLSLSFLTLVSILSRLFLPCFIGAGDGCRSTGTSIPCPRGAGPHHHPRISVGPPQGISSCQVQQYHRLFENTTTAHRLYSTFFWQILLFVLIPHGTYSYQSKMPSISPHLLPLASTFSHLVLAPMNVYSVPPPTSFEI